MATQTPVTDWAAEAAFLRRLYRHEFRTGPSPGGLGRLFPGHDYLIIDLETTGFSRKYDYIWSVGWAVVKDRVAVNCEDLVIDLTASPDVDQGWLRDRCLRQQEQMRQNGRACKLDYERLRGGCDLHEALSVMFTLIEDTFDAGLPIVGHGIWYFDRLRLADASVQFFNGPEIGWRSDLSVDTAMIEKAAQFGIDPGPLEAVEDWYKRVTGNRRKARWSLEPYCNEKYRLAERYGLDVAGAHAAGFDCLLGHALLETYRDIAEGRVSV